MKARVWARRVFLLLPIAFVTLFLVLPLAFMLVVSTLFHLTTRRYQLSA